MTTRIKDTALFPCAAAHAICLVLLDDTLELCATAVCACLLLLFPNEDAWSNALFRVLVLYILDILRVLVPHW